MQELVSFISILVGVMILTAWVMWVLLRPSGDSKAMEFASKSARDGLTVTVIENNELKNRVKQLERENKVLMGGGYSGKEKPIIKDDINSNEEAGNDRAEGPDSGVPASIEDAQVFEKIVLANQASAHGEGIQKRHRNEKNSAGEKKSSSIGGAHRKPVADLPDVEPKIEIKPAVVKTPVEPEDRPVVKEPVTVKSTSPKPVQEELIHAADVSPLSESQRVTDKVEKKKIAEYLASVAEATKRQIEEVEALDGDEETVEIVALYDDDDLKKIKGIGPHLEGKLKKSGITSYLQISQFSDADVENVSKKIGFFPRRIKRDGWIEQAVALVNK